MARSGPGEHRPRLDWPRRTLGYLLTQTPQQLIKEVGRNLGRGGIDYALTGAAAASLIAPFVTAISVAEIWVAAVTAPEQMYDAARADPITDGQNVVFLQAKDDTPLASVRRPTVCGWPTGSGSTPTFCAILAAAGSKRNTFAGR